MQTSEPKNNFQTFLKKGLLFYFLMGLVLGALYGASVSPASKEAVATFFNAADYTGEIHYHERFEEAAVPDDNTVLLIGDSIANQLFRQVTEYNPEINILTTDATMLVTGQYALVCRYLEYHPETTDIYLLLHPMALTRTVDLEWTYGNSVLTLYQTDSMKYLTPSTRKFLRDTFGRGLVNRPSATLVSRSPVAKKLAFSYILTHKKRPEMPGHFTFVDEYIPLLYDLCKEKGVTLHLLSDPVSEASRPRVEELEQEYAGTKAAALFPRYFTDITYYPDEWSEDHSHFSGDAAEPQNLRNLINLFYVDTGFIPEIKTCE